MTIVSTLPENNSNNKNPAERDPPTPNNNTFTWMKEHHMDMVNIITDQVMARVATHPICNTMVGINNNMVGLIIVTYQTHIRTNPTIRIKMKIGDTTIHILRTCTHLKEADTMCHTGAHHRQGCTTITRESIRISRIWWDLLQGLILISMCNCHHRAIFRTGTCTGTSLLGATRTIKSMAKIIKKRDELMIAYIQLVNTTNIYINT